MLQPVGGMDRIPLAFYEQVKPLVRLNSPVTAIRRTARGVRIEHGGRRPRPISRSCTLPAHLLERIPNDFSPAKKAALQGINYLPSVKVAFESPRFWETDDYHLRRARLDRPRQRECDLPVGRLSAPPRACSSAAYVAGWTNPDNPQKFAALQPSPSGCGSAASSSRRSIPAGRGCWARASTVGWGLVPYSEGVGACGRAAQARSARAGRNTPNC